MNTHRFPGLAVPIFVTGLLAMVALHAGAADGGANQERMTIPRIATVDMQVLCKESTGAAELKKQLEADRARILKERSLRVTAIKDLETELGNLRKQAEDPSISESKKQTLLKKWEPLQQQRVSQERELVEFVQRRQRALDEKTVQRMTGLLEEIRKIVQDHAKLEGYDHVLDKSAAGVSRIPLVLYSKDAADITGQILAKMKKDNPPHEENSGTAGNFPLDDPR